MTNEGLSELPTIQSCLTFKTLHNKLLAVDRLADALAERLPTILSPGSFYYMFKVEITLPFHTVFSRPNR